MPSGGSRISVCDVNIAFIRLLAAAMMMWSLVAVGIHMLCRKKFTVSYMCVDTVAGVQML